MITVPREEPPTGVGLTIWPFREAVNSVSHIPILYF